MMSSCQEPGPLEELRGTVKAYARHVLVCTGPLDWGPRIEMREDLLGAMARDVTGMDDAPAGKPKLTALRTAPEGEGFDLLVFPEAVRYRGVDAEAWARIRDGHLRTGEPMRDLAPVPVTGHHFLVCAHGARDDRCGDCGPLVAAALEDALAAGSYPEAHVHLTSHVGGHKFAGNVIAYPGGTWYGYVRPQDAAGLLESHFGPGGVWEPHLRGRMHPAER